MARYITKRERERRARNLCLDCGVPLETQGKRRYVKCPSCRAKQTEASRPYRYLHKNKLLEGIGPEPSPTPNELWAREKMRREAEKALKAEKLRLQIEKCSECEWGRIEENTIFCPFMQGICQKGVYSRGKKNPDQGQRGENPI